VIFVLKEVMHAQPEIFQAELAEIFAGHREWIEIVLFQVSPELAALFLVLAPEKPCYQKEKRYNNRGDDVDTEFALQSLDHRTNISFAAVASGLRPFPLAKVILFEKRLIEPLLHRVFAGNLRQAITDFQSDWKY
jgi:hypothetical protein